MGRQFPNAALQLPEIAEYRNDAVDSLTHFLQPAYQQANPRFLSYSPADFTKLLRDRVEETDLHSSFSILAAVEAALRVDYLIRVTGKRKDPLSRAFRDIYKEKGENARLDDDLLDTWLQFHPEFRALIGEFRAALHFRHWLAHGRYWVRPRNGRFDYISLYTLASFLFSNFPLHHD
jgi:hypothetical protein